MDYTDFDKASQSPWNRAMYDDIVKTLVARCETIDKSLFTRDNPAVLDIGSGPGGLSLAFLRKIPLKEISLLDLREDGLEKAKERIHKEHPNTQVHIIKADIHEIPLKESSYDLIISRGSIRFWENQEEALKEIRRILKPDGIAYIGGGRGSAAFQERRLKEDNEWFPDNYNMDPSSIKKIPSKKLEDWEYERLFEAYGDSYEIYSHLGDGHWILWKKGERL
ncbi:class I SAM-dependent methyltransferase [Proteiniborus sp. MB09-C3]|uniref:class I SAM-dependent methyltransferase n=1 Tax=Proteiniborus sp. MB09-C3 TaxID=3050072 RepID=UPI002552704C|nr:class I SAM-dependent methyltransferase [Proteiniborus sp. MB09-C3]WIV13411.1 class I SAM-dependent methyltransferase [Proteiniborus sp. MB09-C3]